MTKSPPCRPQGKLSTGFYCSEVRSLEMMSAIFFQPWSGQARRAFGSPSPSGAARAASDPKQRHRTWCRPSHGQQRAMGRAVGNANLPSYNRSCFGWPPASSVTLTPPLHPLVPLPCFPAPIPLFLSAQTTRTFLSSDQPDTLVDAE